jgi:geranyl-CoA carboxylase alpha subunit
MLAKIIATGGSREEARRRLVQALEQTVALGTGTNRAFLIEALNHPEFVAGKATTQFIPKNFPKVAAPAADASALGLAAVLWFETSAERHGHDPAAAWSSSGAIAWPLKLETGGKAVACAVTVMGPGRRYRIEANGSAVEIAIAGAQYGEVRYAADGQERTADHAFAGDTLHLRCGSLDLAVRETLYAPPAGAGAGGGTDTEVRAPMNGKIVAVLVKQGEAVAKGQRVVIVEAMKMQHEMTAGASGTVVRVAVKAGDQVATRQLLVELKPAG